MGNSARIQLPQLLNFLQILLTYSGFYLLQYDGLIGLIMLLMGFTVQISDFLRQRQNMFSKKEGAFYSLNSLGAGMLALYAFRTNNFYFAILETAWCFGALLTLTTILRNRSKG